MAGLIKQLLHPVAMVWVVFIGLTIWHLYQRQRKLALVNGVVVALMFLIGSTPLANALMVSLEKPYLNQEIDGNFLSGREIVPGFVENVRNIFLKIIYLISTHPVSRGKCFINNF